MFSKKLNEAMQKLNLKQKQVCGMTGKSKGSISQYLSGKQVPPEYVQKDIAISLGLSPDYFVEEDVMAVLMPKEAVSDGKIKRMKPEEVAKLMGLGINSVRDGLQQGVFPWGYAIRGKTGQWTYWINANRFAAIEGNVTE